MILLSIILPCYNEEPNLELLLERFDKYIQRDDIELILVNNGSTDDSKAILEKLTLKYKFAETINLEVNQGYGHGIVSGLRAARGKFLSYTHADLQTDPKDLFRALQIIENDENPQNCYVKGNRKGRPIFDQLFTIGMSLFETVWLKTVLWDINAQPNLFHREFLEDLIDIPKDFSLDLYFLYMAKVKEYKIVRLNVVFPPRLHGESKWNTGLRSKYIFIKRTIKFSIGLRKSIRYGINKA